LKKKEESSTIDSLKNKTLYKNNWKSRLRLKKLQKPNSEKKLPSKKLKLPLKPLMPLLRLRLKEKRWRLKLR